ncbi:hypothetical protein AYX14_07180 [Cryptococcus neoformans]|nr:hypothetical protein AYX14_07180 [Cryptococcus neoformans var. grubii]
MSFNSKSNLVLQVSPPGSPSQFDAYAIHMLFLLTYWEEGAQ